jgi:hypothetical protein
VGWDREIGGWQDYKKEKGPFTRNGGSAKCAVSAGSGPREMPLDWILETRASQGLVAIKGREGEGDYSRVEEEEAWGRRRAAHIG